MRRQVRAVQPGLHRTRPLDAGPYAFIAADALSLKVRQGGGVVEVAAMVASGVNAEGYREILGLLLSTSEDGAGWLAFFRDLAARGLTGVRLVTGDAPPFPDVWWLYRRKDRVLPWNKGFQLLEGNCRTPGRP